MEENNVIGIEKAAGILKLLGDKTRLTIMKILEKEDCCVCEFVEIFQASQPAISQHMRKLKDAGLVKESRRGQWMIYSFNHDYEYVHYVHSLLMDLPDQLFRIDELIKQGKRISCE